MRASVRDKLLRSLPLLYQEQTIEGFASHSVAFLAGLVECDAVGYNEVNLARRSSKMVLNPPELLEGGRIQAFDRLAHEHPLVQHQQRTGDMSARKVSDFLSRAKFHDTGIYQELYRKMGAEDQFAFGLSLSREVIVALAMNRGSRTFTENDRQLLNLVQPHMVQAYRNAETSTRLLRELNSIRGLVDELALALVILDRHSHVQFATTHGRMLLRKYFPNHSHSHHLPPQLSKWLRPSCNWNGQPLPAAVNHFIIRGTQGHLTVRRARSGSNGQITLVMEETSIPLNARPLETLNLTRRQAEVLLWVAQGKSNSEIAVILGASPRTIQKHLEHILARLGVESRTAAARQALEILKSNSMHSS